MSCTITATSAAHGYQLVTTYSPTRPATPCSCTPGCRPHPAPDHVNTLHVYAYLDAHVNGNGGGGTDNGGADTGAVDPSGVGVVGDTATVSQATNRDYAVPTFMALASPQLQAASVGYAGSASDGLTDARRRPRARPRRTRARPAGHIVLTEQLRTPAHGTADFDLSLGFGRTQAQAVAAHGRRPPVHSPRAPRPTSPAGLQYDAGLTRRS